MKSKLLLGLALVLSGGLFGCSSPAQRHSSEIADSVPASQKYAAYWLNNEANGGYVKLVLTRRPLAELPGLSLPTNQPVLDCDAVIVTTYERDSIWSIDKKPFKPLTGVTMVGSNFIVIKGEQFACTSAKLEDVLRLLRNPAGTILIHRIDGPPSAQKEPVRTFVSRLERQLAGRNTASNPSLSVESFKFIGAETTMPQVIAKVGQTDRRYAGSFCNFYHYRLSDGTDVTIGADAHGKILFVQHGQDTLFGDPLFYKKK